MANNSKIGVFDSGIGGVTVLKEILKILPKEDYIYYSDSIHNPYGDREENEIIQICKNITNILIEKNCKVIVVACNTASAIAIDSLREAYPDKIFIGIEPAYKMVHDQNPDAETLIMATKGTIESERFHVLYQKYNNHKTHLMSCVGLADVIEEGKKEKIQSYLNENLSKYRGNIKNVVLGCTHYPLIKDEITEVLGNVNFYEGSSRLADHLKNILEENDLLSESGTSQIEFIDTTNSAEKKERFFQILER